MSEPLSVVSILGFILSVFGWGLNERSLEQDVGYGELPNPALQPTVPVAPASVK